MTVKILGRGGGGGEGFDFFLIIFPKEGIFDLQNSSLATPLLPATLLSPKNSPENSKILSKFHFNPQLQVHSVPAPKIEYHFIPQGTNANNKYFCFCNSFFYGFHSPSLFFDYHDM